VDRFHAAGLRAGARDNGAAGPRPDYGPTYYAAFLLDPDGNNLEAVCMEAAG
jgi:predicted lactoylglutathione lyase